MTAQSPSSPTYQPPLRCPSQRALHMSPPTSRTSRQDQHVDPQDEKKLSPSIQEKLSAVLDSDTVKLILQALKTAPTGAASIPVASSDDAEMEEGAERPESEEAAATTAVTPPPRRRLTHKQTVTTASTTPSKVTPMSSILKRDGPKLTKGRRKALRRQGGADADI